MAFAGRSAASEEYSEFGPNPQNEQGKDMSPGAPALTNLTPVKSACARRPLSYSRLFLAALGRPGVGVKRGNSVLFAVRGSSPLQKRMHVFN